MPFYTFHATTTITVHNHATLLSVWRGYNMISRMLIGHIIVETPLTESQLRRLSSELRSKVQTRAYDDFETFLETLWSLNDSRENGI